MQNFTFCAAKNFIYRKVNFTNERFAVSEFGEVLLRKVKLRQVTVKFHFVK